VNLLFCKFGHNLVYEELRGMEEEDCSSEVDPLLITDPLEVDVNQLVKLEPEIESEDDVSLEDYEDPDYILEGEPGIGFINKNWVTPTRLGATVMGS